jgi:hypothetical protein
MRNLRKEVEAQLLGSIYPAIGIDKPSNHDDIVEFIFHDVEVTADPVDWHSGDVSIAFRRFLESKNDKPCCTAVNKDIGKHDKNCENYE